jgi:hypothetical protein
MKISALVAAVVLAVATPVLANDHHADHKMMAKPKASATPAAHGDHHADHKKEDHHADHKKEAHH